MDTSRYILTNRQWDIIEPLCLGRADTRGNTGRDNRVFVEAVLWIARTDAPWRDLPPEFGNWNSAFKRFRAPSTSKCAVVDAVNGLKYPLFGFANLA